MQHQPDPTSEGKSTSCQDPPCYCIQTYTYFSEQNTGIKCTTDEECMKNDPEFVGYCGTDKTYEPILKPSNTDTNTDTSGLKTWLSNFD